MARSFCGQPPFGAECIVPIGKAMRRTPPGTWLKSHHLPLFFFFSLCCSCWRNAVTKMFFYRPLSLTTGNTGMPGDKKHCCRPECIKMQENYYFCHVCSHPALPAVTGEMHFLTEASQIVPPHCDGTANWSGLLLLFFVLLLSYPARIITLNCYFAIWLRQNYIGGGVSCSGTAAPGH